MTSIVDRIRTFQSTAPVNVEALIESLGINLDRRADLDPAIAGQIEKHKDGTYRISANAADHYYRRRFTMAHELGHYLFHRDLIGDGLSDNRAYRSTDSGKFNNQNVSARHEAEANKFAAHLLMPPALVRQYYNECNGDVEALSKKFLVSSEAMRYRLNTLGLA